jgi:hypothetical protein
MKTVYDSLFNHIEDVKGALNSPQGLCALPCANHLTGLEAMEITLRQYYGATSLPTVYGDAKSTMQIIHLRDSNLGSGTIYNDACRERFLSDSYRRPVPDTDRSNTKCPCTDDAEFNALLA